MFVARENEMRLLQELYDSDSFQMVPIWGRRRVGKTRLISEFVSSKPRTHFFTARRTTARENLAALSSALVSWHDPNGGAVEPASDAPVFPSFEAALSRVFALAQEERAILVIDEYPYLAESYPGISSLLQSLIDANRATSRLMLIICGSSMSFMEHQVLGEKSPLYGRRTSQLKLEPWDCFDAQKLLRAGDPVRAVELYSLVGGVPLYLEQLDARRSTEWNIAHALLGQGRMLYAEPQSFLLQEFSSPSSYEAVLGAIARGRTRPAEIADATGIQAPNVNEYLRRLSGLGVVARRTPVGKTNKHQVSYRITDNLLGFWHTFVPRYGQAVDVGLTSEVARRITERDLSTWVGHAFEEVCRQWLVRQTASGALDILPARVGSWWGTDPTLREQVDVDVVMVGSDGELVCGECKWTNDPVGADVIEVLAHRAGLVMDSSSSLELVVFSKSGFADSARREADRQGNVRLVEPPELFD